MSEHAWRDRIPAYVLEALDREREAEFERHLDECPRCREEVRAYREVVSGLAALTPRADPGDPASPGALEAGRGERAASGPTEASPGSRARPRPVAEPPAGPDALRLPGPRSGHEGRRVPTAIPWLLAVGGLIAAVVAGVAYWEARSATGELRLDYQQALARVEQLEAARAQRDSMLATLRGGGLRTATLSNTGREPHVRLFWNPSRNRLLITAFDLPPAASGRTYQLWGLARDRDPVGLATFQTGRDSLAVVVEELRRGEAFERSSVTDEPAGGSPRPTTTPLLVGAWEGGVE